MAFTLVFEGTIRNKPNPLTTETVFGVPVIASIGDVSADADCFREALEEIVEASPSKAADIAQAALDERTKALSDELKTGKAA